MEFGLYIRIKEINETFLLIETSWNVFHIFKEICLFVRINRTNRLI